MEYIKSAEEVQNGIAVVGPIWFKHNVSSDWMPGIGSYTRYTDGVHYGVSHVSDPMLGTMWPDYIRKRSEGEETPDTRNFNYAVHPHTLHDLERVDPKYIDDCRVP